MTMLRDTRAVGPNFTQIAWAVFFYSAGIAIGAAIIVGVLNYLFVRPVPLDLVRFFFVHNFLFCLLLGIIGLLLAYWPDPRKPPPPEVIILILALVSGAIISVFFYAHANRSPAYAVFTGVESAWAWGVSVVGGLYWTHLGVDNRPYWNSWFNLFAAVFAAAAVGYA